MRRDDWDLGGEIRLGAALFTLVEPHQGHEVAYNRWYERDHFYAGCMVGPWLLRRAGAGCRTQRPQGSAARRVGRRPLFGDDRLGSYLALYWTLKGRPRRAPTGRPGQVNWLHANGRMFAERDHIHTLLYLTRARTPATPTACRPSWRSTTRSGASAR